MLYTDHWNLDFAPFADDYKAGGLIPTRNSSLVVGRLRYALAMNGGVAALYGAAGVGKTHIIRELLGEFAEAKWLTGYLPNPCCGARDILQALDPSTAALVDPGTPGMSELRAFLAAQAEAGQPVLLAVDDVQAARGTDFLELLRTLLNIGSGGKPVLSLLLGGQPAMERRLEAASRLDTRLAAKAVVTPMTPDEAKLYILARLKAAGSKQGLFTRQGAEKVVELTKGVPRQINRLCELALVIAFGLGAKKIDPAVIEMAAADLDMLPGEETAFFAWSKPGPKAKPETGDEEAEAGAEEDILASLPVEK